MNRAKAIIGQLMEDGEHEFYDLMRSNPYEAFNRIEKEPMIEALWEKPRNLSRDPEERRGGRIVNTVSDFIQAVGVNLEGADYPVVTTELEVEGGIELEYKNLDENIRDLAVDWACEWLVRRGHLKPEEVGPLKKLFSTN